MASLTTLLAPGVIGAYTHFEVTEVFAIDNGSKQVRNVFTLAVAEDLEGQPIKDKQFIGDRIRLKSLAGMKFGVARYTRAIGELPALLDSLGKTSVWCGSGDPLLFGELIEVPNQFIPPDSGVPVPWNKVLKNNFWNGSHVFEWSDRKKIAMTPFFEESRHLQELSEQVAKRVPINLAALSDRLGNLAVQLPVTVIMSSFGKERVSNTFTVDLSWHQKVTPRPLTATCELEFDGAVNGYSSAPLQIGKTQLSLKDGLGQYRGLVWDERYQILLAATGPSGFVGGVALNVGLMEQEPRTFTVKDDQGNSATSAVGLITTNTSLVGDAGDDRTGGYTRKRMYEDQLDRLTAARTFVQYKPDSSQRESEHQKALADLRALIGQHGRDGAWLWDPFLTARDVLDTLFHCPYFGTDLRALTAAQEVPLETSGKRTDLGDAALPASKDGHGTSGLTRMQKWLNKQRDVFDSIESNWRGLRLEYRVKHGSEGFGFHDRFLIFPRSGEDALVWSLGTSVNGVGMEHHILQRVDNGQLIRDAFLELWDQLNKPEHLVWKKP